MRIIFATQNQNKLNEVRMMLPGKIEIIGLDEIGCEEEIPETQPTLEGNALEKARYVSSRYGVNCFSDDTGLEVDALDGRPGVYSARYAGESKNSSDNMKKVLDELKGEKNRSARFRTVIALIVDNNEYLFEGVAEGEIIEDARGEKGFGYDPVFVPTGYDVTFAEMPADIKNQISHRRKAFNKLYDFLLSNY